MQRTRLTCLVERARRYDESAWTELVQAFTPRLAWVARHHRLAGDDASDVVQVTWIQCFENLHRLREPCGLPTWLVTTCRRECLRVLSVGRRCSPCDPTQGTTPVGALSDPESDPFIVLARKQDAAGLRAAISKLPDRQRLVLAELIRDEEAGYATASKRLGIPVGSLGPTRQRAIERLREDERLSALVRG